MCLATIGCAGSIEQAKYKVLEVDENFELRFYEPRVLVETEVESSMEDAGNKAFRKLFNYISGNNQSKTEIAMTIPVSQEKNSEQIEMTTPVSQESSTKGWKVSFLLPQKYTISTAPSPLNPEVYLREIPKQYVVAVQYSGRWKESTYTEHLEKLFDWMKAKNFSPNGNPSWARYNSPWTPWFLRKNEILIPVLIDHHESENKS